MVELTETLVFQWKPKDFEVSFATVCDNALNNTYAHSIVARVCTGRQPCDFSQPSCNRGCGPPADTSGM